MSKFSYFLGLGIYVYFTFLLSRLYLLFKERKRTLVRTTRGGAPLVLWEYSAKQGLFYFLLVIYFIIRNGNDSSASHSF